MRDPDRKHLSLTIVRVILASSGESPTEQALVYVELDHPAFGRICSDAVKAAGSAGCDYMETVPFWMTPGQIRTPMVARVLSRSGPTETHLVGSARVDLRGLANVDGIDALVQLDRPGGGVAGTLELSLAERPRPGALAAESPPAYFESWRERVREDVASRGFLRAWEKHLPGIVYTHASGVGTQDMVGPQLYTWMQEDPDLAAHFEGLPPGAKTELEASLLPGVPSLLAGLESLHPGEYLGALRELLRRATGHEDIREADGEQMLCLYRTTFENWGRTVRNVPALTCVPRTVEGLKNVVRWAAKNGKRVRAAGYRHTWGSLYSSDDDVLVSFLPLNVVEDLPATHPPMDPNNELQGIRLVGQIVEDGREKALCRIGAGTTNEQFRQWCLDALGGNWAWTVPLNVIMVEITWGGSNAPMCHGAGRRHRTLSDLVTEVELVNAKGEVQLISDPKQLRAASGCLGLLGIVAAITIKLDPMTFARMRPIAPRIGLTIPPPGGRAPAGVDMSGITEEQMADAWDDFVGHAENDYYAEWFWFPYRGECWVNCWNNDGTRAEASDYPDAPETFTEEAQSYLGQLANQTLFRLLPARWQADLTAAIAMVALPRDRTIVAPLIDALHFRRGIQNMRVLDMEMEIPIPPRADDPSKPDWTICQKAWWAVIDSLYMRRNTPDDAPMLVALEMRVMGDSGVIMAPQHGNSLGTCSIEVLTNLNTPPETWRAFMQEITDVWTSYVDPRNVPLNVRPHWAKQWSGLRFRGIPANEYLRTVAYRDRLPEFAAELSVIAAAGGYTLADARLRFSNPLLDEVLGPLSSHGAAVAPPPRVAPS